jgi:hypothetical protein
MCDEHEQGTNRDAHRDASHDSHALDSTSPS